jgi:lysozyme
MFRNIRTWLRLVEQRTGVKPILYVNQRFVNVYLSQAPDIKRDYRVWIARYSEYKPDVHLAFWQLCPDGRVAGIHPEVDINVFNGYQSQFEEFLANETIQK